MKYENKDLKESLEFVRSNRNIQQNIYFFNNLIQYEYDIYKKNSTKNMEVYE